MLTDTTIRVSKATAFANMMPPLTTPGGTLQVITEVESDSRRQMSLEKAIPQGFNPKILLLKFIESQTDQYVEDPQEVRYTEQLTSAGQYTSIELLFNSKILATIDDIEIVS